MPENFADRLLAAIDAKGSPVCVGLDPNLEKLPPELSGDPAARVEAFCLKVIEAVAQTVPAVKPQIAYFERLGSAGVAVFERVVAAARSAGLIVIGDVKRGDIGATAAQYAAAYLAGEFALDAVTVNSYFGIDGLQPFIEVAGETGRGLFALVRTSNPSARQVQDFIDAEGKAVFEHVAECVAAAGSGLVGSSGYSAVGAVVGATYPDEARRLRELMPRQIFLVPGYGAQGGTAADAVAGAADDGRGIIVNASRSVIYAFAKDENVATPWAEAVADAAKAFAEDVRGALSKGSHG